MVVDVGLVALRYNKELVVGLSKPLLEIFCNREGVLCTAVHFSECTGRVVYCVLSQPRECTGSVYCVLR